MRISLLLLALFTVSLTAVAERPSVQDRIARLERQLSSKSLVDMLGRIDELQKEVQQLRGEVEQGTHEVGRLSQRQRELYLDIDRRISLMERAGGGAGQRPTLGLVKGSGQSASSPPAQQESKAERGAYQKAFDLLKELRYEEAIGAFTAFLKSYPKSRYAHIGQYWKGDANYARRHFRQAIGNYRTLLDRYPKSQKVPAAMLKIGYSHSELGENGHAKKILEALTARYPQSPEAQQAKTTLKELSR